jgi:hypothetical protein
VRYRVEHLSRKRWVRGISGCSLGAAGRIAVSVALARKAPARIVNTHGRVMVTITRAERGRYKVA